MQEDRSDHVTVSIREITGGTVWVSMNDGMAVFNEVAGHLTCGRRVRLSFADCTHVITAFLNVAVGQLYSGKIPEDLVERNLTCVDASEEELAKVGLVVANAKRFFAERRARAASVP